MELMEKLAILGEAARYDASCASSGSTRQGKKGSLGSTVACGVCHSWSADGRCVSLLKILLSNACIYNCAYCANRCGSNVRAATFTPDEVAKLTTEFYRRNYIEGLFLSSGVVKSPDYTMELMIEALTLLRGSYGFNG
jgi:predicted DNA-binding helix-hairpin-helix protein